MRRMGTFVFFAMSAVSWLLSQSATAATMRYNIVYHHRELARPNQPGLLMLKRDILAQHGESVDLRGERLVRIVLFAKSRLGHGRATLSINGDERLIPQGQGGFNPQDSYDSNRPESYSEIHFDRLQLENSNGPWQIQLQGAVKVHRAVVVTRDEHDFPPPPVNNFSIRDLWWSSAGANGPYCTQFAEPADPHTWSDNFLCSQRDYGFRWSSAGPIRGMHCVQIQESADPHTWNDNFLCSPRDYGLVWSSAGPVDGMSCLQIHESADPHTWDDNYLCARR